MSLVNIIDNYIQDILIGTCGFSYKEWNNFYPPTLEPKYYLKYYSKYYPTVEIDSTFYHLPSKKVVINWIKQVPSDFTFSIKLPKLITHDYKLELERSKKVLVKYFNLLTLLEENNMVAAHLIQLPPSFSNNEHFVQLVKFFKFWNEMYPDVGKWIPVVEFRNKSWEVVETYSMLKKLNIGYCTVVEPLLSANFIQTRDDIFYMRFHGFGRRPWWNYQFSNSEIKSWALKIKEFFNGKSTKRKLIYFNNHFSGNAITNSMDLVNELGLTNNYKYYYDKKVKSKNKNLFEWIKKK